MTEKKSPAFKNWNNLYALVIGVLLVLIVLFYLFTKHFE
jgi:ABC-type glycerol-3-phosphate transport system permease component